LYWLVGKIFEESSAGDSHNDNEKCSNNPQDELGSAEESKKLVEIMCWFRDGAEKCNECCTDANQHCADEREACERFSEYQGCEESIEDQAGLRSQSAWWRAPQQA